MLTLLSMIALTTGIFFFVCYTFLWYSLKRGQLNLDTKNSSGFDASSKGLAIAIPHFNNFRELRELLFHLHTHKSLGALPVYILDDYSDSEQVGELLKDLPNLHPKAQLIPNEGGKGKKAALANTLLKIESEFILQLDSDVLPSNNLLEELLAVWEKNTKLIVAAIKMRPSRGFWSQLGALDHLAIQLSTFSFLSLKKPIMANGATMLYQRECYLKYHKIGQEWSSGEDTFLVQALAADEPDAIAYNPRAYSTTNSPHSFLTLVKQRLRWGAKTTGYPSTYAKLIALVVAYINLYLPAALLISLWTDGLYELPLGLWILKMIGDYALLKRYSQINNQEDLLKNYPIKAIIHPLFTAIVVLLIPFAPKQKWL